MRTIAQLFTLFFLCWSASSAQIVGRHREIFASGGAVWSFGNTSAFTSCGSAVSTCSQSVTVPSGNVLAVVAVLIFNTANNPAITSITGIGGTDTGCAANACQNVYPAMGESVDLHYVILPTAGAATLTVNIGGAPGSGWGIYSGFWAKSTGAPVFDKLATALIQNAGCTTCMGASFTGLAGNDLLINVTDSDNSLSSPGSPYALSSGFLYNMNTSSGTAGTVSQSPSGHFIATGAAFK